MEPKHKKKVGKGSTLPKTYYHLKDIQFLLHEPIVNKFRQFKVGTENDDDDSEVCLELLLIFF